MYLNDIYGQVENIQIFFTNLPTLLFEIWHVNISSIHTFIIFVPTSSVVDPNGPCSDRDPGSHVPSDPNPDPALDPNRI